MSKYDILKDLEEEYLEESIVLIRGLRNGKDLEDEINLREWLKLYDNHNVVYLISHKDVRHISSSGIRNLKGKYPDLVKDYLV